MLIGITGLKQSGKGTTAKIIGEWAVECYGENGFCERGFADYVKWSVARIFHPEISMNDAVKLCDQLKVDDGAIIALSSSNNPAVNTLISFREALQHMGTDVGRKLYHEEFWINKLIGQDYDKNFNNSIVRVISDVRFDNEAAEINRRGGVVLKIERPGLKSDGHDSEAGVSSDLIWSTFVNDSTLEDFKAQVRNYLPSR